jgi:hydrogenase maturation factor
MHDTAAPECHPDVGCITCGDTAVSMRVVRLDESRGLALCVDAAGARETVETSLVDGVEEGTTLLVHAAVALQRLGAEEEHVA